MVMRYTDQDRARDYVQRKTHTVPEQVDTAAEAREMGFTGASQHVIDALNEFKTVSDRDYQKVVEASMDRRRAILDRVVPHFLRDRAARRSLLLAGGILATGALATTTAMGLVAGHNVAYGFPYFIRQVQSLANQIGETGIFGEAKKQVESGGKFITGQVESGVGKVEDELVKTRTKLEEIGLLQGKEQATIDEAKASLEEDRIDAMGITKLIEDRQDPSSVDPLDYGFTGDASVPHEAIVQKIDTSLSNVTFEDGSVILGEGEGTQEITNMAALLQAAEEDPNSLIDDQARDIIADRSYSIDVEGSTRFPVPSDFDNTVYERKFTTLDTYSQYDPSTQITPPARWNYSIDGEIVKFADDGDITVQKLLDNKDSIIESTPNLTEAGFDAYIATQVPGYNAREAATKILNEEGVTEDGAFVKVWSKIFGLTGARRAAETLRGWLTPLYGAKYLANEKQVPKTAGDFTNVAVPATIGLGGLVAANQANKIAGDVRHIINPASSTGPLKRVDDRAMLRAAAAPGDTPEVQAARDRARLAFTNNQRRVDYLAKTAGNLAA